MRTSSLHERSISDPDFIEGLNFVASLPKLWGDRDDPEVAEVVKVLETANIPFNPHLADTPSFERVCLMHPGFTPMYGLKEITRLAGYVVAHRQNEQPLVTT